MRYDVLMFEFCMIVYKEQQEVTILSFFSLFGRSNGRERYKFVLLDNDLNVGVEMKCKI